MLLRQGNYALFLAEVRKSHKDAEKLYLRAIETNPEHANSLYNYAVLLDSVYKNYDRAEQYYKRAIKSNPRHAFSLYNYAVLLEEVRKDYKAAEEHFQRSVDVSPNDPLSLTDYAEFIRLHKPAQKAKALEMLTRAVKLDPASKKARKALAAVKKDLGR